ncbi:MULTISPECIES: hypothetical protein [Hyphobacterium]|uniref:Uncharacterized protein n=1 Tax=Hyphobacterium vulgare TaxID=1736751 RepID=A0ABV6ZZB6_9PROT
MLRFASIAALALVAAACTPPADEAVTAETAAPESAAPETAAPETGGSDAMPQMQAVLNAPDAQTLHAFLLANEAAIIPSDWHTGEPAGQQFWDFPDTLDGYVASSECAWTSSDQSAMNCLLTVAEPDGSEDGPRSVMYRAEIGYTPEGELTLLSPNVRWATMG